jgi:hypothetical protein
MAVLLVTVIAVDHFAQRSLPALHAAHVEHEIQTEAAAMIIPTADRDNVEAKDVEANGPEITNEEYGRITNGMTQVQVLGIVGSDGELLVESGTGADKMMMRLYHGADTARATVTYVGGLVTRKAELGLQ